MKNLLVGSLVALATGLLIFSCSSSPSAQSEACEQSAFLQALAEQRWQEELEQHVLADEAVADDPDSQSALSGHDHSADALFSARVDMILAEAETRKRCG